MNGLNFLEQSARKETNTTTGRTRSEQISRFRRRSRPFATWFRWSEGILRWIIPVYTLSIRLRMLSNWSRTSKIRLNLFNCGPNIGDVREKKTASISICASIHLWFWALKTNETASTIRNNSSLFLSWCVNIFQIQMSEHIFHNGL